MNDDATEALERLAEAQEMKVLLGLLHALNSREDAELIRAIKHRLAEYGADLAYDIEEQ